MDQPRRPEQCRAAQAGVCVPQRHRSLASACCCVCVLRCDSSWRSAHVPCLAALRSPPRRSVPFGSGRLAYPPMATRRACSPGWSGRLCAAAAALEKLLGVEGGRRTGRPAAVPPGWLRSRRTEREAINGWRTGYSAGRVPWLPHVPRPHRPLVLGAVRQSRSCWWWCARSWGASGRRVVV